MRASGRSEGDQLDADVIENATDSIGERSVGHKARPETPIEVG
jgi:hypothetical protein